MLRDIIANPSVVRLFMKNKVELIKKDINCYNKSWEEYWLAVNLVNHRKMYSHTEKYRRDWEYHKPLLRFSQQLGGR